MIEPNRITKEEVQRRLAGGEHIVFLDTRSEEAWNTADAQIPGSRRVPPDAVERYLHEIPHDGLIVTYCT
jgi:rhodanese-related sulfurtransferase